MKHNLVLSARGQITLPAGMRKSLGLGKNAIVTAEEVGGKIVLSPAMVVETELYSDEEVAQWVEDDTFDEGERARLAARLNKRGG